MSLFCFAGPHHSEKHNRRILIGWFSLGGRFMWACFVHVAPPCLISSQPRRPRFHSPHPFSPLPFFASRSPAIVNLRRVPLCVRSVGAHHSLGPRAVAQRHSAVTAEDMRSPSSGRCYRRPHCHTDVAPLLLCYLLLPPPPPPGRAGSATAGPPVPTVSVAASAPLLPCAAAALHAVGPLPPVASAVAGKGSGSGVGPPILPRLLLPSRRSPPPRPSSVAARESGSSNGGPRSPSCLVPGLERLALEISTLGFILNHSYRNSGSQ